MKERFAKARFGLSETMPTTTSNRHNFLFSSAAVNLETVSVY